jgi:hypothetical protein
MAVLGCVNALMAEQSHRFLLHAFQITSVRAKSHIPDSQPSPIASKLRDGIWGFEPLQSQKIYPFSRTSWPPLEPTQIFIQLVLLFFPRGLRWPWRAVAHSLPSSTEAKNEWSYMSDPFIRLHGVDSDTFTTYYQRGLEGWDPG